MCVFAYVKAGITIPSIVSNRKHTVTQTFSYKGLAIPLLHLSLIASCHQTLPHTYSLFYFHTHTHTHSLPSSLSLSLSLSQHTICSQTTYLMQYSESQYSTHKHPLPQYSIIVILPYQTKLDLHVVSASQQCTSITIPNTANQVTVRNLLLNRVRLTMTSKMCCMHIAKRLKSHVN